MEGRSSGDGAEFIAFLKCSLAPAPRPCAAITGWGSLRFHSARHEGPLSVLQLCWWLWVQVLARLATMSNLSGQAPFQLHPTHPANSIHCPPPAPIIHHLPPTIHCHPPIHPTTIHPSIHYPSPHQSTPTHPPPTMQDGIHHPPFTPIHPPIIHPSASTPPIYQSTHPPLPLHTHLGRLVADLSTPFQGKTARRRLEESAQVSRARK